MLNLKLDNRFASFAQRTAFLLASLLFLLPFINPIHRLPLPTFDSECLAGLLLALSLSASLFAPRVKLRLQWPLPTLLICMVILTTAQYLRGHIDYSYQVTSFVLVAIGILGAYGLGRWAVATDSTPSMVYMISVCIVTGCLISNLVQWMQVRDVGTLPFWLYFPMEREIQFRAVANLGQPNQLAAYFSMGFVALLFLQSRQWPKLPVRLLAAVMASGIALTQSRMGLLMAVLLAAACLLGPLRSLGGARRSAGLFWSAACAGYLFAWITAPLLSVNLDQAIQPDVLLSQASSQIRLIMWSDAIKVIAAQPLLGVGAGQYPAAQYWVAGASEFTQGTPHVHNLLLQIAAEFGVAMAVFTLSLLLWWTIAQCRTRLADASVATVWALVLLIVLHSFLEWPLWVFFVAVPVGLLAGLGEPPTQLSAVVETKTVLAPIGFAALIYSPLMFLDYDRVSVAAQLLYGEQAAGRSVSLEAQVAVLEIGDATFFKPQMERQLLSLLSPQKPIDTGSIELTRRVLGRLPDDRVIARYITLLALNGQVDEAIKHVDRMRTFSRSPVRYLESEQIVLTGIALEGAHMDPLRRRLGEMRP